MGRPAGESLTAEGCPQADPVTGRGSKLLTAVARTLPVASRYGARRRGDREVVSAVGGSAPRASEDVLEEVELGELGALVVNRVRTEVGEAITGVEFAGWKVLGVGVQANSYAPCSLATRSEASTRNRAIPLWRNSGTTPRA